jgi:hypothetical protein
MAILRQETGDAGIVEGKAVPILVRQPYGLRREKPHA